MSAFHYAGPRRYPWSTSARTFPEVYYNERNVAHEYPRVDPYSHAVGAPVSRLPSRTRENHHEFQPEQGGARRRIAVACARCRKRKIRCTGDSGDGEACQNCKIAGVDVSQCIFHRVGSDQVDKIMDSYNLVQGRANVASGHNTVPMYSTGYNGPYRRSSLNGPFPQPEGRFEYPSLDSKPLYESAWTSPYGDDTSPINDYSFDQSQLFLPNSAASTGSNPCGISCRCTPQSARLSQPTTSYYSDYGHAYISDGLPHLKTEIPPVAANEPMSPLNMSSLQLTLPERPRQRQMQPTEVPLAPRRRLPAPTPRSGHGLYHALDHQQDQRLRSSQTFGTPSFSDTTPSNAYTGSLAKPLLPWAAANENLVNAVNEAAFANMPPPATTSRMPATIVNNTSDPFAAGTSTNKDSTNTRTPSQDLQFDTFPLLDPSLTAPTSSAYSNFRESRDLSVSPTIAQLSRNNSSPSLYTHNGGSKRPSFLETGSSNTLVSGRQYTPLSQPIDSPNVDESSGLQKAAMLSNPDSNLESSY